MPSPELIALAKQIAATHGLDPALVCAVCDQESAWNPWAIRYEDAFYHHYVDPQGTDYAKTESRARAFSWGIMQLMGEVAREMGYSSNLAKLCDPAIGIEWGCKHLAARMATAKGDLTKALLLWNGGGNKLYPDQVIARMEKYK